MKLRPGQLDQAGASDGQVLTWDSTNSRWQPETLAGGYSDPLTTKGDLVVRSSSATSRLAAGTDGHVLTADSTQTYGVKWAAAGGGGFNPNPVDDPANWSADLGYDQEFSGSGSTPPSGWAWLNQGSGTYSESFGAGVIDHPGQSGNDVKAIIRALPSESVWTATAKVVLTAQRSNYVSAGIVIHDSTSGELILFGFRGDSGGSQAVNADDYTNATTFGAARFTITDTMGAATYFRVKRNSSTSWDFLWSNDGIAWRTLAAANNISTFLTPSHIGFGLLRNGTSQALASCHWFRVR